MRETICSNIKQVSELFREGLDVSKVVANCLRRANDCKPLNAFISIQEDRVLSDAQFSSARYKKGKPISSLDGIPVAVKDNFCTKFAPTTCASKMLENFTPPYNATVCQRLIDAGALVIGKTNMDQFAMGSGCTDGVYGPTKNIWGFKNEKNFYISGGSSGGSAVAVATGSVFAAIGSDTGGSTRNPASYTGLIGLKPTYGLISRYGLIPLVNSMDCPGILTRCVDDCWSVLSVVAGHDQKDPTSLPYSYQRGLTRLNCHKIKGIKIGIPHEFYTDNLSHSNWSVWNEVALLLRSMGATVCNISMPNIEYSIACYSVLNQCEVASNMARFDGIEFGYRACDNTSTESLFAKTRSEGLNDVVRNRILTGNYFLLRNKSEQYFRKALRVRRLISQDFDRAFDKVDIILTPTTLTEAPLYEEFIGKTNRDQCAFQDFCTQPANIAGVPAVSIPIQLSDNGMPLSVQLIGKNLSEPFILSVAKQIENEVLFPHFSYNNEFTLAS